MTAKDIAQIETELGIINTRIGKLDTGLAVILEKFEHIVTREDVEKEITQQIETAQAKCQNKKSAQSTMDWVKIIKVVGLVSLPIISAITGHQIGVN